MAASTPPSPLCQWLRTIKRASGARCETREAARRAVFEYIEMFYDRRRRHSTLGQIGPDGIPLTFIPHLDHKPLVFAAIGENIFVDCCFSFPVLRYEIRKLAKPLPSSTWRAATQKWREGSLLNCVSQWIAISSETDRFAFCGQLIKPFCPGNIGLPLSHPGTKSRGSGGRDATTVGLAKHTAEPAEH
jgi:hypothetical protein